jgi:hypothetical protein
MSSNFRPVSYSEGHIHLPRIESNLKPLITPFELEFPETPTPTPTPTQAPHPTHRWMSWALRFSLHLSLIGLFETLFFWQFVSKSEDEALISLIGNYVDGALSACPGLPVPERQQIDNFINTFINSTLVNLAGDAAYQHRTAYNSTLVRNSWLYFGCMTAIFASLVGTTCLKRWPMKWRKIVGENVVLIMFLGIYEFVFFRTIIFNYKAISMDELDQRIINEFNQACAI